MRSFSTSIIAVISFSSLLQSCNNYGCDNCIQWFVENDVTTEYSGLITEKYIDSAKRATPWFRLDNGSVQRCYNLEIFTKAEIGDSLYKIKGSLKNYIVRNGRVDTFYQRCCDTDITDDHSKN